MVVEVRMPFNYTEIIHYIQKKWKNLDETKILKLKSIEHDREKSNHNPNRNKLLNAYKPKRIGTLNV